MVPQFVTTYLKGAAARCAEAGYTPVLIARWAPGWKGARLADLAPAQGRYSREEYLSLYSDRLGSLSPTTIKVALKLLAARTQGRAALVCYEQPGEFCHRRLVAEWLETRCRITVPELGYRREFMLPAELAMPAKYKAAEGPWQVKCRCGVQNPCTLVQPFVSCPCGLETYPSWG